MTKRDDDLQRRYPDLLQQDDYALYELVNDLDKAYTQPEMPEWLMWIPAKEQISPILRFRKENTLMIHYPRAILSAVVAIVLSLLLGFIWEAFTNGFIQEIGYRWPCLAAAIAIVILSFARGKPHISYAGLHSSCWVGSYWLAHRYLYEIAYSENGMKLFLIPIALSLLLILFIKPILIVIIKLQRFFGILNEDELRPAVLKQDPFFLYNSGYKARYAEDSSTDDEWSIPTLQPHSVSQEGEQYLPYRNHPLEQPPSQE